MVTHDYNEGLVVVSKDHPKKKIKLTDFPGLDPEKVREEVSLSRGKKLLLIFLWATDEEVRLFRMHPEVGSWDVTAQTNREKRKLIMLTARDGNGK